MNQPNNAEAMFRNWIVIWGGLFSSFVMLTAVSWVAGEPSGLTGRQYFMPLFPVLSLAGAGLLAVSFVLKKKLLDGAIAQQSPLRLQTGYILAWAFCDAVCFTGVVGVFVTKALAFYGLIGFTALVMLAHRPKREDLHATMYKKL